MTRLAPLPPKDELREIDAALARAASCPRLWPRATEILRERRAVVAAEVGAQQRRSGG